MDVACGIRAFDPHELLCHMLAERQGYYSDEQITVRVCDTTFTPDASLPTKSYFQVACGAAGVGRRAGHPWKVVFVGVDRPMFWVHGTSQTLAGGRIAGYPPGSPPDGLLREALGATEATIVPSASDAMRLGLVRLGAVDAAVLSSAATPPTDLKCLLFVGADVRAATTGIAVHEHALTTEPGLVAALVRAHSRALADIRAKSDEVAATLTEVFGLPSERLDELEPCFTRDGRTDTTRDPELFDYSLVPRTPVVPVSR